MSFSEVGVFGTETQLALIEFHQRLDHRAEDYHVYMESGRLVHNIGVRLDI